MSGTSASWTLERRARQAEIMRARNRDRHFLRRKATSYISPEEREARRARMKKLNQRIRDDADLREKVIKGQKRVRREPAYRAMQAEVMRDLMARRPDLRRRAKWHCVEINKKAKRKRGTP